MSDTQIMLARRLWPASVDVVTTAASAFDEEYHQCLDALPNIVWLLDADGQILRVNQSWWDMSAKAVPGQQPVFEDILAEGEACAFLDQLQYSRETGEPLDMETVIHDRFRGPTAVLARALPACGLAAHGAVAWFGSFTDVVGPAALSRASSIV